jgi:hypothetical protein
MKIRLYRLLIIVLISFSGAMRGQAQTRSSLDDLYVSYIYAAVMGTGTYKIDERRISMLRVPFSYTQRKLTEEQAGIRWHLPVVIGYDSLNYADWLDRILEDELVTLTVLPGFEIMQHYSKAWVFKPFGNLGMGFDFVRDEPILMGVLGLRMLGTWEYEDTSEFRVGTSMRYAAEYQIESEQSLGFTMVEAGVDYRRNTHLRLFSRDTNAGVYYRAQLFLPEWDMQELRENQGDHIGLVHEIGVSIGLKKTYSKWGLSVSRVRTGFKFGDGIRGWTFGTEFPF